jgi:hypothetical protein
LPRWYEAVTAADVQMRGGGYYSAATVGAREVIDRATPLVLEAIDRIDVPADAPFWLADLGCADAGTSLDLMRRIVGHLSPREVAVVYTDQPRNDYNALFENALRLDGAARALASATSFYQPVVPAGTLQLAFSATAMQWLSRKPVDLPDAVHSSRSTAPERSAFVDQAREDWATILRCRHAELAPGGRFVSLTFGVDEAGRFLGNTGGVSMHDTFHALWAELAEEGAITAAELRAMTLPQHYRSVDEFVAPLSDAGFALEHVSTTLLGCPFARSFARHRDPARFALEYVPTLRSWTEGTFAAALDPVRPAADRAAIIERYYDRYAQRVRRSPEGHGMDYVHVNVVARRG